MERNSNFCESRDETTKSGKILSHWFDILLTKQRIKMRKESEKEREMESKSEWAVRPKKILPFHIQLRRFYVGIRLISSILCVFLHRSVFCSLFVCMLLSVVSEPLKAAYATWVFGFPYTHKYTFALLLSFIRPFVFWFAFFSRLSSCVWKSVWMCRLCYCFFLLLRFLFLTVFLFVSVFRFPFSRSPKSKNCCCRFVSYLILFCIVSYRKSTENMCV